MLVVRLDEINMWRPAEQLLPLHHITSMSTVWQSSTPTAEVHTAVAFASAGGGGGGAKGIPLSFDCAMLNQLWLAAY